MSTPSHIPSGVDGLYANLTGYGHARPADLEPIAARTDWPALATAERSRQAAQFLQSLPVAELEAIARGDLDLAAVAAAVYTDLTKRANSMSKPTLSAAAQAAILAIAVEHFGVETLDTRRSDSLDFHDVAVWCMRDALAAAYLAGMVDHHRNRD